MNRVFALVLFVFALLGSVYCVAEPEAWQDMTDNIDSREFNCIAESQSDDNAVYVGTASGLYLKKGDAKEWKQIFICRGEQKGINDIYVDGEGTIYIATKNGLYRSCDSGKKWQKIFSGIGKENLAICIASGEKNGETIYLGTGNGLFRTEDNGKTWKKSGGVAGEAEITAILASGDIFAICNNVLYKISPDFADYEKIFSSGSIAKFENSQIVSEEDPIFLLNGITREAPFLYLFTNRGLFVSGSNISWIRFTDTGLSNRWVNDALISETGLPAFAATESGIFKYNDLENEWTRLYEGMVSIEARRLMLSISTNYLWALCRRRVYRMKSASGGFSKSDISETEKIFLKFANEPTINEVQRMAIEYAEVYPEKIAKWRRGAQFKALLPKLNFGLDYGSSDTYEIYTASSRSYWVYGPEDETEGWDLNFSWDLSDLVWNESQTSIDVRSKLMVQLRDDIVDEVTRTYFERRRLQIENLINPTNELRAKLKNQLRIQELTAGLDGLTGSRFSAAITKTN